MHETALRESSRATDKRRRQSAIREILNKKSGTTHEEIKSYLYEQGIRASQATVSRDLREMGVAKIPVNDGRAIYRLSGSDGEFTRALSNYPISYEAIGNLIVVKTTPGNAPGLCFVIDNQRWSEIAGTVAGDDTIFIAVRNPVDAKSFINKLEKVM